MITLKLLVVVAFVAESKNNHSYKVGGLDALLNV